MLSTWFDLAIIFHLTLFSERFVAPFSNQNLHRLTFLLNERLPSNECRFVKGYVYNLCINHLLVKPKSRFILYGGSIPEFPSYESNSLLIEAAASYTSSSYKLLGTKSLGVDYGLVRTGLAVSIGYSPNPLAIISNMNSTQLCQEIVKYCEKENIQQIVLGLPLHKNGTVADQTTLTRDFAQQLVCSIYASFGPACNKVRGDDGHTLLTAIPIYLWDERYTSKEAEARIRGSNPKRSMGRLYGELDADAACIILEHFYADSGKGAERVLIPQHDPALLDVIRESWSLRCQEKKKIFDEKLKMKEAIQSNAKQRAIERAIILDAQLELQYGSQRKTRKRNKK